MKCGIIVIAVCFYALVCKNAEFCAAKPTSHYRSLQVGDAVQRGPDWKWGDKRGRVGTVGTVVKVQEGVVFVRWPTRNGSLGTIYSYHYGKNNTYHVVFTHHRHGR